MWRNRTAALLEEKEEEAEEEVEKKEEEPSWPARTHQIKGAQNNKKKDAGQHFNKSLLLSLHRKHGLKKSRVTTELS